MEVQKTVAPPFTQFSELASQSIGGRVLFATDDWFAPAEWMLEDAEPVFVADKFTPFGKWMDGWETRRKRIAGHDWCIVRLAAPALLRGVMIDTAHFTGNFAPRFSLQGALLNRSQEEAIPERDRETIGTACSERDLQLVATAVDSDQWTELIGMTPLKPGYEDTRRQYFTVERHSGQLFSHVRLNIFPDGGIARLRIFGLVEPDFRALASKGELIDLLAMLNGGHCLTFSNAHYGHPRNLIKPNRGINMGDGWETARRLDRPAILRTDRQGILQVPGCEWAIFQLCAKGTVEKLVVDTNHFKGNFPDNIRIEGALIERTQTLQSAQWKVMLSESKLGAHREHVFQEEALLFRGPCTHVRITIAPDGGISRVRLFGIVSTR